MHFEINVRRVAWVLAAVITSLTAAHFLLAHRDSPIWRLVNLDAEASFGTWYASFAAMLAGILSLLLAALARRRGVSWVWWALLGLALVTLGVDEVAQVHEGVSSRLGSQIRGIGEDSMAGTPLIGLLVLPFTLLVMWGISKAGETRATRLIVGGLSILWLGAFAFEELENRNHLGTLPLTQGIARELGDFILVGIQETLEMVGVALIIIGLLSHFAHTREHIGLNAVDPGALEVHADPG